jgi:hypothetical protein
MTGVSYITNDKRNATAVLVQLKNEMKFSTGLKN